MDSTMTSMVEGFNVSWHDRMMTCSCKYSKRVFQTHGVYFCGHIQRVVAERGDTLPLLSAAHVIVFSSDGMTSEPFELAFSISNDHTGREVHWHYDDLPESIGFIPYPGCRLDVIELAEPYLVEWAFTHQCKLCRSVPGDWLLDADSGSRVAANSAVRMLQRNGICDECWELAPKL